MSDERQDKSPAVVATELTLKMLDKASTISLADGVFQGTAGRVCEVYEKFYLKAKQLEEAEETE